MENQNMEQKIAEINLLDARLKEIEQALELIERQISELQMCKSSIDELKNLKKETETLAPIGAGIFASARLKKTDEVLVDIGTKVICKKTIKEAEEMVGKKMERAANLRARLADEAQGIVQSIMQIENQMR